MLPSKRLEGTEVMLIPTAENADHLCSDPPSKVPVRLHLYSGVLGLKASAAPLWSMLPGRSHRRGLAQDEIGLGDARGVSCPTRLMITRSILGGAKHEACSQQT